MFGAPRTASRAIAAAVSAAPSRPIHASSPGSNVWSSRRSRRPSHASAEVTGSAPGLDAARGSGLGAAASLNRRCAACFSSRRGRARGAGRRRSPPNRSCRCPTCGRACVVRASASCAACRSRRSTSRSSTSSIAGAPGWRGSSSAYPARSSTRRASAPASRARRSCARAPTASCATSARSPRRSASTAAARARHADRVRPRPARRCRRPRRRTRSAPAALPRR